MGPRLRGPEKKLAFARPGSEAERFLGHLPLFLRQGVHGVEQLDVELSLQDVAAREHPLLGGLHDCGRHFRDLPKRASVIGKARDIRGNEAIDHAANTDRFAGEDAGVDCCLGIVANDAADKLHSGWDALATVVHLDLSISILEVAVAGTSSEIDPTAEIAVTEKAVMLLVRKRLDNRTFDFASNLGRVTDRNVILNRCMLVDSCPGTEVKRTTQETEGTNGGIVFDQNRSRLRIGHHKITDRNAAGNKHSIRDFTVSIAGEAEGKILVEDPLIKANHVVGKIKQIQIHWQWIQIASELLQRQIHLSTVDKAAACKIDCRHNRCGNCLRPVRHNERRGIGGQLHDLFEIGSTGDKPGIETQGPRLCRLQAAAKLPMIRLQQGLQMGTNTGTGLFGKNRFHPIEQAKRTTADRKRWPTGRNGIEPGNKFVFEQQNVHGGRNGSRGQTEVDSVKTQGCVVANSLGNEQIANRDFKSSWPGSWKAGESWRFAVRQADRWTLLRAFLFGQLPMQREKRARLAGVFQKQQAQKERL